MPGVRAALIDVQRAFAARPGGAVLDGRDIGTVVCPESDVKIFVTANAATRAQRRALELLRNGEKADYNAILADIVRRDSRDSSRAAAPLRPADDAVQLDTTHLGIDAAFAEALSLVEAARIRA
jgi:cytidylate kinase